uniref:Uncharacterized protein n=1 Tax=Arion vulgaris TaxID=1028688 RepID=A0A0B6Y4Y3_9EUPU
MEQFNAAPRKITGTFEKILTKIDDEIFTSEILAMIYKFCVYYHKCAFTSNMLQNKAKIDGD